MLKQYLLVLFSFVSIVVWSQGRTIDDIRQTLERNSQKVVQEKVYMHLDNTCYFVGDTLWYKAYVVRADDLHFTDMSRILYVELLTPDGLVAERQRVVVSDKGYGDGCFVLHDSLYSGYYELRAYTRWMLNFNVSEHRFGREDRYSFYNYAMACDFFRQWNGLYSRVVPVYGKPEVAGDFSYKRMFQRPKQNVVKAAKEELLATFYPEGGRLVKGIPCRVAFELTDQDGLAVMLSGMVSMGDKKLADMQTEYMGRGAVTVTPGDQRLKASFLWKGKNYSFDLPKADESGATVAVDGGRITLRSNGLPTDRQYGLSILCRGVLRHFEKVRFDSEGKAVVPVPSLPTGVNDVTLFDQDGRILADRLFFVNNHDYDGGKVSVESGSKSTYTPYEQVNLSLKCDSVNEPTLLSVAVRDTRTDEASYNDGDIRTDLLLGSELRGFVARPAYYFESDDAIHQRALDLLMMVQGWRKYKWQELADNSFTKKRYQPETTLTVEGGVYKMLSVNEVEPDEIASWAKGSGLARTKAASGENEHEVGLNVESSEDESGTVSTDNIVVDEPQEVGTIEYSNIKDANAELGVNHGGLNKEVLVEAEVIVGGRVAGLTQRTHNGGRFLFQVPPFYGDAILNMKAYNENDSTKRNMASRKDKTALDEDAYPDYYVKRDMFYPRFPAKYAYYQNHAPETGNYGLPEEPAGRLSMENDDHLLQNVDVKGKRRGKRAIDYTKPVYVADVYEMYNELTDYGLSFGKFDMRLFPMRVCQLLYGNMGRHIRFNVDARINGWIFYRNYVPDTKNSGIMWDNHNPRALYNTLKLKRLDKIRIFSDYEPRNEEVPMVSARLSADATVEFLPIPDDAQQPSSRDRHIVLHGFNVPLAFYSPDYSKRKPTDSGDYRRTLYWNPNVKTDAEGRINLTFFTGSKETRVKVSAAGITPSGRLVGTE